MSYTRIKGATSTTDGYYVGAKGSETKVIDGNGNVVIGVQSDVVASFATASSAQTVYVIAPFNGNIIAAYCAADTANISAAYTVKAGSAGATAASVTQSTAASVAGFVSSMTLGTVAVTAGQSLSILRGVQGTTAASYVTVVIQRTS